MYKNLLGRAAATLASLTLGTGMLFIGGCNHDDDCCTDEAVPARHVEHVRTTDRADIDRTTDEVPVETNAAVGVREGRDWDRNERFDHDRDYRSERFDRDSDRSGVGAHVNVGGVHAGAGVGDEGVHAGAGVHVNDNVNVGGGVDTRK